MSRHPLATIPSLCFSIFLVLLALLALPALAQVPADEVLKGFQPTGELQVEIDGVARPEAELFYADRARAYLLMAPELASPVLIELGQGQVGTVSLMKVVRREGGTDILADADVRPAGPFTVQGTSVSFTIDGKSVSLSEKPSLLGLQHLPDLLAYDPGYGVTARGYQPDAKAMAKLESLGGSDVRVRVYFGSWCPFCKRHVPYILRVEKDLEGKGIDFEYFGLAKPAPGDDGDWPSGVKAVPTAVVYVGDKEVGRFERNEWRAPEVALSRLLAGS